jgi:hypothetical protein
MSRMNSFFAVLVLAAMVGLVPSAQAKPKVLVMASGSSAMWQTTALGAFNGGSCPAASVKVHPPCFHYASKSNFNLNDLRPTKLKTKGSIAVDSGAIWIVWDSNPTAPLVWAYIKVDSVVGNRCFFANPVCTVNVATFPAGGGISSSLWGADATVPASIQAIFTAAAAKGVKVNSAATDIRPEDAAFAECRVNSALGNGTINGGGDDGLDGLGYNSNNAAGTCPQFVTGIKQALVVGNPIKSGYPASTGLANVLAFNLSGPDPFSGLAVYPTGYKTISVGAAPITFVFQRSGSEASGGLVGLTDATDSQLQTLFSGADCDASTVLGLGTGPNPIGVYLREPLSGTMNTTEATVFRRPVTTLLGSPFVVGASQEANVGGANPLSGQPCVSGSGIRSRAIGTGEEVKSVLNSFANNAVDGIGYTFFSFGNVGSISNNAAYGYITLNGVDPIFSSYTGTQPGQPGGGKLPGASNVCSGGGFPCSESAIWGAGNLSFPNLRNGSYGAWSVLRMVASNATVVKNVQFMVDASQQYVVLATPDYVPATKSGADPGLTLVRSHYQQLDGNGANLGGAASNSPELGGDMGGCVLAVGSTVTGSIQTGPGVGCTAGARN